jgi:hypothetical protein
MTAEHTPPAAVVDYTERARGLLKCFSHDWDMEAGIKKVAAALSAVASEHQAEIASMRSLLDTVYECERTLIAERDAALGRLARLQEPDVRETVAKAIYDIDPIGARDWSNAPASTREDCFACADAALTKIAEIVCVAGEANTAAARQSRLARPAMTVAATPSETGSTTHD